MSNYFYDMIPADELARLSYVPTVCDLLEKMSVDYANAPALSNVQTTLTYAQLVERVGKRRETIASLGLKPGAKIAIFDRNSIDAVELFLAITSAGYVAIVFPAALAGPALIGSIRKFDVEAVFVRDEFQPLCAGVPVPTYPAHTIADTYLAPASVTKETIAAIFFTGGTTGTPKGVILSHGALMRGAYNGVFMPGSVLCGHRYIALLPFSHVFGLIRSLLSCLYTGALVYTCEDMKQTIGSIPMIKPTCLVLVPGLAEMLFGLAKMRGIGFLGGELKTIIAGAANVPPRLIADFETYGINLLEGYGLTETANLVSGNADVKDHAESVGKAYPGQELKIVDGELWIKGDNLFEGYYNDPEATQAALQDGWLHTGDLARIDEDGFIYIVGRIKNLIILANGENISPESLEDIFYKSPFIKDCLVKEEIVNGNPVLALEILPQAPALPGLSQAEIEAKMRALVEKENENLPTYARIMKVTVRTEDFKRTGSLKIDRLHN